MKCKTLVLLSLLTLAGCSDVERAKFTGNYSQWYSGLQSGVTKQVVYRYHEHLIDSVKIECDYYIELDDGKQLKFTRSHHAREMTCRYETGENVNVEVYEDSLGHKEYKLVGID